MVYGSTVAGEYNDIHYAPAALPCDVKSEPQLTLVTTCTRILLPSLRSTAGVAAVTSLCMYIPLYVVMYLPMNAYVSMYTYHKCIYDKFKHIINKAIQMSCWPPNMATNNNIFTHHIAPDF